MRAKLRQLTLRIKRIYFDQIASGEKSREYRADTEYYASRLEGQKYDTLMLHYQKEERLYCEIKSIKRIVTPASLDRKIIPTEQCWEISLSNPVKIKRKK